jgi:signal transduction histidine kinase
MAAKRSADWRGTGGEGIVRLFAASARNLVPRLISSVTIGVVAAIYLGPVLAVGWFVVTWSVVFAGIGLMDRIRRCQDEATKTRLGFVLTANSTLSSALNAAPVAALWFVGDETARAFALVTLFIGAAYVLLHYYAMVRTYYALMTPYAAAVALIAVDMARRADHRLAATVVLLAGSVALVNFFGLSRRLLDQSRTALRQARLEARRNEAAAEAANVAKSSFLAIMSHEIRTPLNGVLGMAQAMAAGPLSKVQRERLDVVHQSGEALLAILNNVLDLSKIEAGRLELEEIDFDLGELLTGIEAAFSPPAKAKGLTLAFDVAQAGGRWRGDPTRLRQILWNLVSNALKFTGEGRIDVKARADADGLLVEVKDTGPGIAPATQAALFTEYVQADASTTRAFGGSGLGLAICQRLARLMGGEISLVSEKGAGSAFTLRAPLARSAEAATAVAALPAAETGRAGAIRVLAAEDNEINRLVLATLLQQADVELVVVENGAAAVAAWEEGPWDVILMDVEMPVMDGPTATAAIRRREGETGRGRTPIIALTANAMAHQVGAYLAAGMDGHLAKPIEAKRLFEALQAGLAKPHSPAEVVAPRSARA